MGNTSLNEYVLSEFENIVNEISDQSFYDSLKCKEANVRWMKIYDVLKKEILNELTDIWKMMWEEENMAQKLDLLDKLKKANCDKSEPAWRPKLADIQPQTDHLELQLESVTKEYYEAWSSKCELTISELKTELSEEWENLKNGRERIECVRRRNRELCNSLQDTKD